MKKLSVIALLGIFCLPVYSQNVVKSFYEQQTEFDNPQFSVSNKADLKKLVSEASVNEAEKKAGEYIYGCADKMELFVGMDPNDGFFGEMFNVIPGKIMEAAPEINATYTFKYAAAGGDSIEKVYTQEEINQLKKERTKQNAPQLLRKLLKNYEEMFTVQKENTTFCLYTKSKRKKTTNIIVQTRFMGMFILVGLSGEWNTKQLTEILSDEESQGVLFSATKE